MDCFTLSKRVEATRPLARLLGNCLKALRDSFFIIVLGILNLALAVMMPHKHIKISMGIIFILQLILRSSSAMILITSKKYRMDLIVSVMIKTAIIRTDLLFHCLDFMFCMSHISLMCYMVCQHDVFAHLIAVHNIHLIGSCQVCHYLYYEGLVG